MYMCFSYVAHIRNGAGLIVHLNLYNIFVLIMPPVWTVGRGTSCVTGDLWCCGAPGLTCWRRITCEDLGLLEEVARLAQGVARGCPVEWDFVAVWESG